MGDRGMASFLHAPLKPVIRVEKDLALMMRPPSSKIAKINLICQKHGLQVAWHMAITKTLKIISLKALVRNQNNLVEMIIG